MPINLFLLQARNLSPYGRGKKKKSKLKSCSTSLNTETNIWWFLTDPYLHTAFLHPPRGPMLFFSPYNTIYPTFHFLGAWLFCSFTVWLALHSVDHHFPLWWHLFWFLFTLLSIFTVFSRFWDHYYCVRFVCDWSKSSLVIRTGTEDCHRENTDT